MNTIKTRHEFDKKKTNQIDDTTARVHDIELKGEREREKRKKNAQEHRVEHKQHLKKKGKK